MVTNINKQHMIVLDLDGTSLYDWKTMKDETVNTIQELKEKGHIVIIATGRPYRASKQFYEQMGLDTPMINYNGALVHHPFDQNFKQIKQHIPTNAIMDVFESQNKHISNAFCEIGDHVFLYKEDDSINSLLHAEGASLYVGDFKETLWDDPNGFIILAEKGKGQLVENYIEDKYKDIIGHRNWGGDHQDIIEVFTPQTCKGIAIKELAKQYGVQREQVIAFGDASNDLGMLEYAGLGVAMHNASDEVKQVADTITKSPNTEHGVAEFLQDYFNLNN
ncbi:Cof-type HAD-IIB family hydrolase [Haloplasma contractile]|uniref:Phosphatase YitU protein n=1 Tax=Haloplasma contractile SSD-17B TaxID=1033810 RepID=F7PV62_9MOLU|nr:Cof-type HAD-IIB family hydrolase [Haloplasma contractile]ERJ10970.1 Putative phosphatase YitU protein [Haloplasma contractile SSD-17B]